MVSMLLESNWTTQRKLYNFFYYSILNLKERHLIESYQIEKYEGIIQAIYSHKNQIKSKWQDAHSVQNETR